MASPAGATGGDPGGSWKPKEKQRLFLKGKHMALRLELDTSIGHILLYTATICTEYTVHVWNVIFVKSNLNMYGILWYIIYTYDT